MSNRRPLETIRGAFKSGQRAENDRVHHCVILITQFRNPYAPDLLAAYGLWGSRMRQSAHTQKGPRDASEAVLAGGPLRVHEAATRVRDLEWPS